MRNAKSNVGSGYTLFNIYFFLKRLTQLKQLIYFFCKNFVYLFCDFCKPKHIKNKKHQEINIFLIENQILVLIN
jgi:hypothetical protein